MNPRFSSVGPCRAVDIVEFAFKSLVDDFCDKYPITPQFKADRIVGLCVYIHPHDRTDVYFEPIQFKYRRDQLPTKFLDDMANFIMCHSVLRNISYYGRTSIEFSIKACDCCSY